MRGIIKSVRLGFIISIAVLPVSVLAQPHDAGSTKQAITDTALEAKINAISKFYDGPQAQKAFWKAIRAWRAYRQAMGETVEIISSKGGNRAGPWAKRSFRQMADTDLMHMLDDFFAE